MSKPQPLPLPFGEGERQRIGLEAARSRLSNRRGRLLDSYEDWTAAVALSTTATNRTGDDLVDVAAKISLWKEGLDLQFDAGRRKAVLLHAAAELAGRGEKDAQIEDRIRGLMVRSNERRASLRARADEASSAIKEFLPAGKRLLPHQEEALVEIEDRAFRLVVHDDLGLGKTIEVLASILLLVARRKMALPVLVGCQTSMVGAWSEHAEEWLSGIGVRVGNSLDSDSNVVVMPYGKMLDRWRECKSYDPRTVVYDESHYLKNPETQRAKAAILASSGADHVLLTTATMDPNGRPEECFLQLKLCDRSLEWWEYRKEWCNAFKMKIGTDSRGDDRKVWNTKGSSNPVGFGRLLHKMSFRRTKADLGKDLGLPELSRFVIPVHFSSRALGELAQIEDGVKIALRAKADALRETGRERDLAKADRIEESAVLAATTVLRMKVEAYKIPAAIVRTKELLDDGHRVVLFCFFPENTLTLYEALKEKAGAGRTVMVGTADLDAEDRAELVRRAQADADALCLTYAYCEGITLTAFDRVVIVGRHWIPDKETQAEARIDRIGQTRPPAAEYLHGRGTLDDAMAEVSVLKETTARAVVGSTAVRMFQWLNRGGA